MSERSRRAGFYVDGFNLYHALNDLKEPHLKWLDLSKLADRISGSRDEKIVRIVFCTAYPTHIDDPGKIARHEAYVRALTARGVTCILGRFAYLGKQHCKACRHSWDAHEEKESDVNLAVELMLDAADDVIDRAYLLTSDRDFSGMVRKFKERFPEKTLVTIAPPGRPHSSNILQQADEKRKITRAALEACLLPARLDDPERPARPIRRPPEYEPPPGRR